MQQAIGADVAARDAAAVAGALEKDGVVRINGALSPRTANSLLTHVNGALEKALLSAQETLVLDSGDVYAQYFGKVLARTHRHDLKLSLTPQVSAAVEELLGNVGPMLSECLGDDAVLYECAALIADPGAPQQPFHPDTRFREDQGIAVLTSFIALQPIAQDMGPTRFLPRSHNADDHAAFNTHDDESRAFFALLRSRPCFSGILGTGDATVFDSRLLHCGTANDSPRRRVLFYVSFRARDAQAPPGTLLYDMRDKHALSDWSHCWAAEEARVLA